MKREEYQRLDDEQYKIIAGASERSARNQLEHLKRGFWCTAMREEIALSQVDDGHLYNILNMYAQGRFPFDVEGVAEAMATILFAEAKRRGMYKEEAMPYNRRIEVD